MESKALFTVSIIEGCVSLATTLEVLIIFLGSAKEVFMTFLLREGRITSDLTTFPRMLGFSKNGLLTTFLLGAGLILTLLWPIDGEA